MSEQLDRRIVVLVVPAEATWAPPGGDPDTWRLALAELLGVWVMLLATSWPLRGRWIDAGIGCCRHQTARGQARPGRPVRG